jgi:hypothetical protein
MAGIPLKFSRPVDKTKLVVTGATIGGAIVFGITAWPLVRSILTNTYIWSSATIVSNDVAEFDSSNTDLESSSSSSS